MIDGLNNKQPPPGKIKQKIHAALDAAEARNESFTIMNCITIASERLSKVREVEMTMGQKQGGDGGSTKDNSNDNANDPTRPPKKRRRRNKKAKDSKTKE